MEARRFLNSSLACEAYRETRKGPPHNDSGGAGTGTIGTGLCCDSTSGGSEFKRSADSPPEKPLTLPWRLGRVIPSGPNRPSGVSLWPLELHFRRVTRNGPGHAESATPEKS